MTLKQEIKKALNKINWNYGKGDISKVVFNSENGALFGGVVYIKKQYGNEKRNFYLDSTFNSKVKLTFRGHKKII